MERWRIVVDRAFNTFRHMLKYGGNNHRFEESQIEFNRSDNVLWAKLKTLSISQEFKLQEIFGLSVQETNLLRLALAVRVIKSRLLDLERNSNQNKGKKVGLVCAGENLHQEIIDLISEDPRISLEAYYTLAQNVFAIYTLRGGQERQKLWQEELPGLKSRFEREKQAFSSLR